MRGESRGFRIFVGSGFLRRVDACISQRLRRIGAKKMTWAYVLSGTLALALLVYLVAALIRAEDL
jgi:K+-transporting ATPase KdpF subunit